MAACPVVGVLRIPTPPYGKYRVCRPSWAPGPVIAWPKSNVWVGDARLGVPAVTSDFRGLLPIIHKWPGTLLTKGSDPREGSPALLRLGSESGRGGLGCADLASHGSA